MRLIFCLFLLLIACSNPPYRGSEVLGADEFVLDSYCIREGKWSIWQMEGKPVTALSADLFDPYDDLIQEGDALKVTLFHPLRPDVGMAVSGVGEAIGYVVTRGKIELPDLGCIEVRGLTLHEAKERIQNEYRSQIRELEVFVAFKSRAQRNVELIGLVGAPLIPVDGQTRLFEVLAMARLSPTGINWYKSYVVRGNQILPVDLYKLVKEGDMSQNVVMRGGDKIYMAEAKDASIVVLGEVGKEKMLELPNGFMSLRQALAEAGGIPYTGDKRYIQVIRGSLLCPKIYTLNWKHILQLPNDSLLLMPGDLVYVASTPIADWNRFVNQVLPTLVALDILLRGAQQVGVTLQ